MELANMMEEKYGIPSLRVSYLGIEDMAEALYDIARFFKDPEIMERTKKLVEEEVKKLAVDLEPYRKAMAGKKAAIYVGGSFKAFSLVKSLRLLDMQVALVGSQTGTKDDYAELEAIVDPGTVIIDDANPLELINILKQKKVDVFIGGVKERPIAYKLGIGFCDHNHERKEALAGFEGMLNFAKEVHASVMSPVWQFVPRNNSAKPSC
jgi:nitrogenase molybdenum-cofactor synthesis protein NifE